MTSSNRHAPSSRHERRLWRSAIPALALGVALGVSACGNDSAGDAPAESNTPETTAVSMPETSATDTAPTDDPNEALATAGIADVNGAALGDVTFTEQDGSLQLTVNLEGMEPGFYGFHVHEIGKCEPDSAAPDDASDTGAFKSSGGHIPGQEGNVHPNHAGDLPTLLVGEDGTALMTVTTDRLDQSLLMDDDGSAVVIHAQPDNFANIPTRYAADGPDEETKKAGDAGERMACGVVQN